MCVSTFEYNRLTNELHGLETQQRFLTSLEKYGSSNLDKGAVSFLNLGLTNLGLESVICNDVMTSEKGRLLITLENAESEKKNVGAKIKEVLSKLILLLKKGFEKLADFFSKFFNFFKRKEKDVTAAHQVFTKGETSNVPTEQANKMTSSTGGDNKSETASEAKSPDNKPATVNLDATLSKKGKYVFKTSGNGWTGAVLNKDKMTYREVMSNISDWQATLQKIEDDYLKVKDNYDNDVKNAAEGAKVEYRYDGCTYIKNDAALEKKWNVVITDENFVKIDSIKEPKPATNVEIDFSSITSMSPEINKIVGQINKVKKTIDETTMGMLRNRDTDLKVARQILWINQQRYALLKVAAKMWTDYIHGVYTHAYGSDALAAMNKNNVHDKYLRPLDK